MKGTENLSSKSTSDSNERNLIPIEELKENIPPLVINTSLFASLTEFNSAQTQNLKLVKAELAGLNKKFTIKDMR